MATETAREFALRRGFTWAEWLALPPSRRYEEVTVAQGVEVTDEMRAAWRVMDLPAEGGQRLAAFRAAAVANRA